MSEILINQIQTPDGTILRSFSTHDFQSHRDKNGTLYVADGGTSYLKRLGNPDFKELTVYYGDSFEKTRLYYYFGLDYLCNISDEMLNLHASYNNIKRQDEYFLSKPDTNKNKINHVIETSLLLQEQVFRQKYQTYCKEIKSLLSKYKKENKFELGPWVIKALEKDNFDINAVTNNLDVFGICKFLVNRSKDGNRYYHQVMQLIWNQLKNYEWLKDNEYELERVLRFILKPLEN